MQLLARATTAAAPPVRVPRAGASPHGAAAQLSHSRAHAIAPTKVALSTTRASRLPTLRGYARPTACAASKAPRLVQRGDGGGGGAPWGCAVCGIPAMHSAEQQQQHFAGHRHARKSLNAGALTAASVPAAAATPLAWGCAVCGIPAMRSAAQLAQHLAGDRHARKVRYARNVAVAATAEEALQSLGTMNEWLQRMGRPAEDTVDGARRALKNDVHVNIYDLVEGRVAPVFNTEQELADYTLFGDGEVFPRQLAKRDSQLRLLLRHLL